MPRHRIITRKRNKLTIIAVAGALSVATAASAAAAAWPSGSSASPAGTAFSSITASRSRTVAGQSVAGQSAAGQDFLAVRAMADHQAMLNLLTQQRAAAHRAAVAEAAKRKAQAVLAAKQEAARNAAPQQANSQQANSQQAASQQTASTAAAASGSPQSIAAGMLGSFGWSSSQFSCLEPLWAAESGWSVTATNPSTGAYGIPQAFPGSKMASAGPDWETDAATQIKWGLGYIKDTYGSPCAAWSHEQADGWY